MNKSQESFGINFPDNAGEQDSQIYAPPAGYADWREFSMDPNQANTQLLGEFDGAESEDLRFVVSKLEPTEPTEQVIYLLGGNNG